jgi:hypothetical protein
VSLVWLIPSSLAVLAAALVVAGARSVRIEVVALTRELRGVALLRERAEALRIESRRTARAAEMARDSLGPPTHR